MPAREWSRPRPAEARIAVALAALGAWTVGVPYLGRALGFRVDVASRVEIVDHVVPGIVITVAAGWLALRARQEAMAGRAPALSVGGICFLAGFWVAATHVSLIVDAARGREPWGAALWHASAALPIIVLALWILLQAGASDRR